MYAYRMAESCQRACYEKYIFEQRDISIFQKSLQTQVSCDLQMYKLQMKTRARVEEKQHTAPCASVYSSLPSIPALRGFLPRK